MYQTFIKVSLIAATLAISGCASLKPPVRPDYTGADSVSAVETTQLIGVWQVSDLNPYPNTDPQTTTIEYKADGSVLGEVIPGGESAAVLGDTRFTFLGTWTLDGDTITHGNMEMKTVGGNAMASMMSKMVNSRQNIAGSANIYEISANRIVMVSEDGNAMEYLRQ